MKTPKEKNLLPDQCGVTGSFGPNDGGYIHDRIVNCASELRKAQELYSQGHYVHSNAKIIPEGHPLRIAMAQLSKLDEMYAMYANKKPNEAQFTTYEPPFEDTIRWDKYK